MDTLTKARRSWNMSRIRGTNTKPEIRVRSMLHRLGYRFRLHRRDLPGRPDVVLPKHGLIVFVHGCFWHRHPRCRFAYTPKSRSDFWRRKFDENVKRDRTKNAQLRRMGWRVEVIWECETRDEHELEARVRKVFSEDKVTGRRRPRRK